MRPAFPRLFPRLDRLFDLRRSGLLSFINPASGRRDRRSRLLMLPLEDRTMPDGSLPYILSANLAEDTGASATDRVTWNPTVVGDLWNDDGFVGVGIEVDTDADGVPDGLTYSDTAGHFSYDSRPDTEGPVTYRFRTVEWDGASGSEAR